VADRLVESGGVQILVPVWTADHPGLKAALSTRVGGVSRDPFGMNTSFRVGDDDEDVRANRGRFFRAAGLGNGTLATAGQVHGSTVVAVDAPGHYPDCDGLVTDTRALFLAVSIADCVPILIYDGNTKAVGIVHSGWRGSSERIAEKCLRLMELRFGSRPADLHAYIGAAAGGCCYEVGEEVALHFPDEVLRRGGNGKYLLELGIYNRDLLLAAGIPGERIALSSHCTIHEAALFHSHRRDRGRSGRMMAVIGMEKVPETG
jgi:YfiH family protein